MTAPDIFLSYNRSVTFAGSGELVAHAVLEFALAQPHRAARDFGD